MLQIDQYLVYSKILFKFLLIITQYIKKIIGILEVIDNTSIEKTSYDVLIIILITIFVGAKKSLLEDLIKKHLDFKENDKIASVFNEKSFIQKKWKDIQVGEIIMVIF